MSKYSILICFLAIMEKGDTHYSIASIDAIRKLLEIYHKISIGRRWTFQCVHDLIVNGLIARQPRRLYSEEGGVRQQSSIIVFTMKGLKWLVSKKVKGAKRMLRRMVAWLRGKDTRFPRARPTTEDSTPLENEENLKRLRRLILPIG